MNIVGELAHQMGLLPLLWLGVLQSRGQDRGAAWWWLAVAFGVSWLADSAAHWVNPDLVGNLYPLTQAAIVGAVLLDRDDASMLVIALCLVGAASIAWNGPEGREILLATTANGAVAGIAWQRRAIGRVRLSLLVSFGAVGVCWWFYAGWPTWDSYNLYQGVRAIGLLLFCRAAVSPGPSLTVSRR